MAVRFVFGRSGSGKTRRCLAAIRSALDADPVGGARLILLAPEQATLQLERALVAGGEETVPDGARLTGGGRSDPRAEARPTGGEQGWPVEGVADVAGFTRAEVLSFQRLGHRLVPPWGEDGRILSRAGRRMGSDGAWVHGHSMCEGHPPRR